MSLRIICPSYIVSKLSENKRNEILVAEKSLIVH